MNVGVLLAAGASSRMGRPKALVRAHGQSFLAQGVRHLWAACDTVVAVLGAEARPIRTAAEAEFAALVESGALTSQLRARGGRRTRELELHFVEHRAWRQGMLSSARAGLAEAVALRARGVLVLPVDHPDVRPATVAQLAAMLEQALRAFGGRAAGTLAYALVPRHRGRRGHPLALSPALARAIVADRGAADLGDAVRRSARLVGYLDVADPGVLTNVTRPRR